MSRVCHLLPFLLWLKTGDLPLGFYFYCIFVFLSVSCMGCSRKISLYTRKELSGCRIIRELTSHCIMWWVIECSLGFEQFALGVWNLKYLYLIFDSLNWNVCTSMFYRQLNQDFTVSFAQIIPINIIQWPDSIYIQVRLWY